MTTQKDAIHRRLSDYLQRNQAFYLDLLRQMVSINSFTANAAGVNAVGDLTAAAFTDLGFAAEKVQSANPAYGRHLVLTRPAKCPSGETPKIGLVSHLDTVFPPEEEAQNGFAWRREGDRCYGPGTVDNKGGTVVLYMTLAALQAIAPEAYDSATWVVLIDASEERDAFDFQRLCVERLTGNALACLIYEGGHVENGAFTAVVARKGMAIYHVSVEGKSAHAGSAHEEGANAIVQLADTIQRIAALTDYGRELTFNVGRVTGGTVTNRVPHRAEAWVEMRAFSSEVFRQGVAATLALADQPVVRSADGSFACRVNIEVIEQTPPWPRNPAADRLLAVWQEAGVALGQRVVAEERGGLSDGNPLWSAFPILDGLGPVGGNAHRSEQSVDGSKEQEYVLASSLAPKAVLDAAAILRLLGS
jgi:glutamate carboxypeptidase